MAKERICVCKTKKPFVRNQIALAHKPFAGNMVCRTLRNQIQSDLSLHPPKIYVYRFIQIKVARFFFVCCRCYGCVFFLSGICHGQRRVCQAAAVGICALAFNGFCKFICLDIVCERGGEKSRTSLLKLAPNRYNVARLFVEPNNKQCLVFVIRSSRNDWMGGFVVFVLWHTKYLSMFVKIIQWHNFNILIIGAICKFRWHNTVVPSFI